MGNIVLIHDWLDKDFGAEKILASFHHLFQAPIYTLINTHGEDFYYPEIHTSFLQNISSKHFRKLLPLFPLAIASFDLSKYEMILSSSHAVAKGVTKHAGQKHICYCHTPMRYAWDELETYAQHTAWPWAFRQMMRCIRRWDQKTSATVDHFIANSHFIAQRILRCYQRQADVIYPPVDTDYFTLCENKEDYYLASSRDAPYKKIELIQKAFEQMRNKKLVLIDSLSREKLRCLLQKAKGFISIAKEDFGILPVEAMACGTPVIAYGHGGIRETVGAVGGLLFYQQTPEALVDAVKAFENMEFAAEKLHVHAQQFSKQRFEKEISEYVENRYPSRRQRKTPVAPLSKRAT